MMHHITIQHATDKSLAPKSSLLRRWARTALTTKMAAAELTIRIVNLDEMTQLNATYRHKKGPTNVLSFPFDAPEEVELALPLLGDIVICADVVNREATEQHKTQEAHWAHIVVHGVFHLMGYDHESDEDATTMETLEINTLKTLGFPNPYETEEDVNRYD